MKNQDYSQIIADLNLECKKLEQKWRNTLQESRELFNESEEIYRIYSKFITEHNLKEVFLEYLDDLESNNKISPGTLGFIEFYFEN